MKFSSFSRSLLPAIGAVLLAMTAGVATADLSPQSSDAVVKLIARYGADAGDTLESLPELQSWIESAGSPQKALNQALAGKSPTEQAKVIARLSKLLETRSLIRQESARVPNGVYAVTTRIPPLSKVAVDALKEAGMAMTSKDAYEVTSNMSTGQSAHLLTRLAVRIVDSSPAEQERLIAKFKETARELRR